MKKNFHRLAGLPAKTPRLNKTAENRTAPMAADVELAGRRRRRGDSGLRMARKLHSTKHARELAPFRFSDHAGPSIRSPGSPTPLNALLADTPVRTSIRSCRGAFTAERTWDTAYDRSHDVASVQSRPWQAIRQRSKLRRIDRFACLHHRRQQRIWLDAWLAPCSARRLIAVGAGHQLAKRFAHSL